MKKAEFAIPVSPPSVRVDLLCLTTFALLSACSQILAEQRFNTCICGAKVSKQCLGVQDFFKNRGPGAYVMITKGF